MRRTCLACFKVVEYETLVPDRFLDEIIRQSFAPNPYRVVPPRR